MLFRCHTVNVVRHAWLRMPLWLSFATLNALGFVRCSDIFERDSVSDKVGISQAASAVVTQPQ
jgi:hypothetical protein